MGGLTLHGPQHFVIRALDGTFPGPCISPLIGALFKWNFVSISFIMYQSIDLELRKQLILLYLSYMLIICADVMVALSIVG